MFKQQQSISGFGNMCTLEIADPKGGRGVGFHRLTFQTTFSYTSTETANVQLSALVLEFTPGSAPLGRCVSIGVGLPYQLRAAGGSYGALMALDLTSSQLAAIEDARVGGKLTLAATAYVQFLGLEGYPDIPIWQSFSGEHAIPQSVWIEQVLKRLAYQDYLLLEVPLSTEAKDAALALAVTHLIAARDLASKGDYRQAVAECRPAMDEIERVYGLKPAERATLAAYSASDPRRAEKLDKASRFAVWRYGLVNVIHASHHKAEGHEPWEWGRAGALAVITATAAMIEASYSPEARDSAGPKTLLAAVKAAKTPARPVRASRDPKSA